VRNRRILRSLGSVIVVLTVISLALYKMGNTDEMTAKMNRNVIGDYHLNAKIQSSYRSVLTQEKLVPPLCGGKLGAGLTDGIEGAELAKHPILLSGILQKFNGEIHIYISLIQ
jgi:hypothetical protein